MVVKTKQLGNLGEKIATKYLNKKGYKILERNFRYKGYGEIDIIAKKDADLHFIEVKTRETINDSPYAPEDNITYFKQKQLIKLAKIYLAKNPPVGGNDIPWQIDVIAVELDPYSKQAKIRHIEQAIEDIR